MKRLRGYLLNLSLWRQALLFCLLLPCPLLGQAVNTPQPQPDDVVSINLELNKPLERVTAPGQKQFFQINLAASEFVRVKVAQRGADVVVRITGADKKVLAAFDAQQRFQGDEDLEFAAASAGSYKFEIEAKQVQKSGGYTINLLEKRTAAENELLLSEAQLWMSESQRLNSAGQYKAALEPTERALAIRTKLLGLEHLQTVFAIQRLGLIQTNLGALSDAHKSFEQALQILQKLPQTDELYQAELLNNLGALENTGGNFQKAIELFLGVLSVREKELGTDHTLVAAVLNNLGIAYRRRGDYIKSSESYHRALEIRERTLGKDHPEVARVLKNLAGLAYYSGDYATALRLDRRVLEIREKELGAEHPQLAGDISSLALVLADSGDYAQAEQLYQRALKIYEKTLGLEHPTAAGVYNNLGKLYHEQTDYLKAEPFFLRAKQISEKNSAGENETAALYLSNLGDNYTLIGNYPQAEANLKRALEIREKIFGAEHYFVARTCEALARLAAFQGNLSEAVRFQTRANGIYEKQIAVNLAVGTEHQKLSYLALMSEGLNQTIALQAASAEGTDPTVREQTLTALLQRKGRVLDVMTGNLATMRKRFNPEEQILFDRLSDANSRLSELTLNKPPRLSLAEYQKQIAATEEQKMNLEAEINRRGGLANELLPTVNLSAVQSQIPTDAALIEFAVYQPLRKPDAKNKLPHVAPRYVAYVLHQKGAVKFKDLGAAAEIDAALDTFRRALRERSRPDVFKLARAVDEKVMQPLRPLIGDAAHLLIAPDSELNLVPFEAFVDESGRHLIENYLFTYLTSGRDLLRQPSDVKNQNKPLIIANPFFGEPRTPGRGGIAEVASDVYFLPLGGAAQEGLSIQTLFPDARFLTGAAATEDALKQAAAPRFLHIATHGFFWENPPARVNENNNTVASQKENPYLRAGLALAGANRAQASDDGILTALEASGLNLSGTKLVVLSSCDTGVGKISSREGVYGLRRAFVLAGAESLVMSLWSVSDYMTRELMTKYYQNLHSGMGRGEALRRSQLAMLNRPERRHPFYWAGFIHSGEWSNLAGER
jgi:CHAT domain-containing protein/Flp pilus assembly protein TadD